MECYKMYVQAEIINQMSWCACWRHESRMLWLQIMWLSCKIMHDYWCWCMDFMFVLWVSEIHFASVRYYNFNPECSHVEPSTKYRKRWGNVWKMLLFVSTFRSPSPSSPSQREVLLVFLSVLAHLPSMDTNTLTHLLHSYIMISPLSARDQPYTCSCKSDRWDNGQGSNTHWHSID